MQTTKHTSPSRGSCEAAETLINYIFHPALVLPPSRLNLFKYPIIELSPFPDRFQSTANAGSL